MYVFDRSRPPPPLLGSAQETLSGDAADGTNARSRLSNFVAGTSPPPSAVFRGSVRHGEPNAGQCVRFMTPVIVMALGSHGQGSPEKALDIVVAELSPPHEGSGYAKCGAARQRSATMARICHHHSAAFAPMRSLQDWGAPFGVLRRCFRGSISLTPISSVC